MKREKIKILIIIPLLCCLALVQCKNRDKNGKPLTMTTSSGEITISADESLMPIVDAEIKAFESIYRNAKVNVDYSSEGKTINKLLDSKVNIAIASRNLTQEEIDYFKNKNKYAPKSLKVGIDALALIVHKSNKDSIISYEQIRSLLKGGIKNWKQINKVSTLKDIRIIFDNDSAASIRYLKDSVAKVEKLPSYCFAMNSNQKVIDYVAQNENSIGIIGVSWISDRDDSVTRGFLDKIKVLGVSRPGNAENYAEYYQPYQGYIANGDYPLSRSIYIINSEPGVRLGSGFTAFVAGDKGQRVILKSGLVPATMPVRLVHLRKDPIGI